MNNKQKLAIKNYLAKIDQDILNIELKDGRVIVNHVWKDFKTAKLKCTWISGEITKAVGFFIGVQVFYMKEGKKHDFCGGFVSVVNKKARP